MSTPHLDSTRLEALLESAQLLHSSLQLDDLLRHLLRSVMGRLLVGRGLVALEEDGEMRLALVRGFKDLHAGELFDEEAARAAGMHLLLPIGETEHPLGLLGVGRPPGGAVEAREEEALRALVSIAASGIENARAHAETQQLNQKLEQKVQELRALLDLVRGLSSALEPETVAKLLMLTLSGRWAVRRYALAAWKDGHPPVRHQKGMTLPDLKDYQTALAELPEAVLVQDLPEGELKETLRAQQAELLFTLRSSSTPVGAVVLGARPMKLGYSEADLEFGAGLVAQSVVSFENSWFVQETLERKRLEQELELAANIQERLFPEQLPKISGYDLAARNRPALHCGGDYFDVISTKGTGDAGSYLFCVADVSGKGLPASLLMSNMQATLRALGGESHGLAALAARINDLLYAASPSNKFVTAILLEIDPATGRGRYVNAGHNECMLLRGDGETELLQSTGLPLGMMPGDMLDMLGKQYEEKAVEMRAGDICALYSDGVPEAYDVHENEWGEENLLACLKTARNEPAPVIVETIITELDRFAASAPQHDDITLLLFKRNQ
jgi:sigma-B regulation protein RsbU (phosphoserine phosphatase)